MKKPTIEDLTRIKNEFQEMIDYYKNIEPSDRFLTNFELDMYDHLDRCLDYCNDAIRLLPDLREGVIDDC